MQFIKEEDGYIYAECEDCKRKLKFNKDSLKYTETDTEGTYQTPDIVECFCGTVSDKIKHVPVVKAEEPEETEEKPKSSIASAVKQIKEEASTGDTVKGLVVIGGAALIISSLIKSISHVIAAIARHGDK